MNKRLIIATAAVIAWCGAGVAQARDIGWSVSIDAPPVGAVVSNGRAYHGGYGDYGGYGRERIYVPAPVIVVPPPQVVYQRPYVIAPVPWGYAPYGYVVSQDGYYDGGHHHHRHDDDGGWRSRGGRDRHDDRGDGDGGYRIDDRRGDDRDGYRGRDNGPRGDANNQRRNAR